MGSQDLKTSGMRLNERSWVLAIAGLWAWVFWVLSAEWSANEQYQYGFAVPFAAAYLFWSRLKTVPSTLAPPMPAACGGGMSGLAATGAGFLLFLFAALLHEQDPTWRLVGWMMMASVSLITCVWLFSVGGFQLALALALPIGFAWLALPWPSAIENGVTLKLMNLVTGATVRCLNLTGVAALQHANVIELSAGLVGVDTACSGVQSFQSSMMVALFLGELLGLAVIRRTVLLLASLAISMAGNFARVFFLARAMHSGGDKAVDAWHDPMGILATAGTFLAITILAGILARRANKRKNEATRTWADLWHRPRPGRAGIVLAAGVALIPVMTWAWFEFVPKNGLATQLTPLWGIDMRSLPPKWRAQKDDFTRQERALLRYSEGESYVVTAPGVREARLFHLFWRPEASVPTIAFSHSPEICMSSAGWEMTSPPEAMTLEIKGRQFPCALYYFRIEGTEAAVLHGAWLGGYSEVLELPLNAGNRENRIRLLFTGPRRKGREIITATLPSVQDRAEQLRQFRDFLERVLVPGAVGLDR